VGTKNYPLSPTMSQMRVFVNSEDLQTQGQELPFPLEAKELSFSSEALSTSFVKGLNFPFCIGPVIFTRENPEQIVETQFVTASENADYPGGLVVNFTPIPPPAKLVRQNAVYDQ